MRNVTQLSKPKIDVISIIMSSVGFGSFLYGFGIASEHGFTSPVVISVIIFGSLVIGLFIRRQLKLDTPILEFRIFKFPVFTLSISITLVAIISLIGLETMLPLFVQNVLDFSPLQSGLMLLPGAIVIGIMSPITGHLFDQYGAKWLAIIGLTIVTVTTFMFTRLSLEMSFTYLTILYAVRMFGLSFAMMPVMTAALNQLPPRWYAHGSAMANTLQQVSASIGTAILIAFVAIGTLTYQTNPDVTSILNEKLADMNGFKWAFIGSTLLAFVALVLSLFLQSPREEKAMTKQTLEG